MVDAVQDNVVLVRHDDLDGVGSEVIFRAFGGGNQSYSCNYSNVNETVVKLLEETEYHILICDISVNPEVTKLIEEKYLGRVTLLDHHPNLDHLKNVKWAKIAKKEDETSGTLMIWNEFYGILFHVTTETRVEYKNTLFDYEHFAKIVSDYDLWIHEYPQSKDLNRLFGLIGEESFIERMLKNPNPDFTLEEEYLLSVEQSKMGRYFKSKEKEVHISVGELYVFASQYHSELGHYLLEQFENINVVYLIDMERGKVSLRSRKDFDCSVIARQYGGGGHMLASGFQISSGKIEKIVDEIFRK